MSTEKNIIETALAAGREMVSEIQYENGTPIIVIPDGHQVKEFPHLRDLPMRIDQTVSHTTAQSFIDYYNRYAIMASVIFIDELNNKFTAILDYHEAFDMPNWKQHRSVFELSKTPEWQAWFGSHKKQMTQQEFGAFIETNLPDIITPTGAEMLEIALSMQAKTEIKFSSGIRLDNGQMQLQYNEVIDGTAGTKGQLKIPEKFSIGIKLFRGGMPYQMDARLRYRIKDGNLTIWYELIRPHLTVDANLNDTIELISKSMKFGQIFRGVLS